jgi:hypothetical protein
MPYPNKGLSTSISQKVINYFKYEFDYIYENYLDGPINIAEV